jgi:hypothetical protein
VHGHRLLVTATVLLVAACGGNPSSALPPSFGPTSTASSQPLATPSGNPPSATPGMSVESAQPSAPAETPPAGPVRIGGPYIPGTAVVVTVRGLRVRAEPSTDADIVAGLDREDVLRLMDWPEIAQGYTWYPAQRLARGGSLPPLPAELEEGGGVFGWVAVGDRDEDWVRPLAARCPVTVDLKHVGAMLPAEQVDCFGSQTLELEGAFGCGGCGGAAAGIFKPAWLASPLQQAYLSVDPRERLGPLALSFPPNGPRVPGAGTIIRVRGHFSDSRADSCVISVPIGSDEVFSDVPSRLAVGVCRQRFAVESFDKLGVDPDFPFG